MDCIRASKAKVGTLASKPLTNIESELFGSNQSFRRVEAEAPSHEVTNRPK